MIPPLITELAMQAQTDHDALLVLGDLILETGWFDARVMQTMWPLGRAKRNGERTPKAKLRRRLDKEAWKAGFPDFFSAFAARPTEHWARAVLGVALFDAWQKGRWAAPARCSREVQWRDIRISLDNVEMKSVTNISWQRTTEAPRGNEQKGSAK